MQRTVRVWVAIAAVSMLAGSGVARADGTPPAPGPGPASAPSADGMPSQSQEDLASTDPANGMHSAGWADLPDGVSARPYVSALSIINDGVSTPVVVGGSTAVPSLASGQVSTVISPFNLCASGVTPEPNRCYATPNRVGLTLTYANGGAAGHDFGAPSVPVTPAVNANSVIDLTVALNSLGKSLRWTWVSGDLISWQTNHLGQDDASVHIRFRPAPAPFVQNFPQPNGCTATPIFNCEVPKADFDQLSASMVFSLDQTLDPVLTGAVFATQGAFYGFLSPTGSANAPSLDIQLASSHLKADGTPQVGTLQAFVPAASLLNLYGILPADAASVFTTTRAGDPGSNGAPSYSAWTSAANGSDGVLVTVRDITFSAPRYRVAAKRTATPAAARVAKKLTTIRATTTACSRKSVCVAAVYDLGSAKAARFTVRQKLVAAGRKVTAHQLVLTVKAVTLPKGHRFLLVVHSGRRLVASTVGTVG